MKLSRSYKLFSVILVTLTLLFACSRQQSNGESINGGVLTPHSGIESEDKTNIGDSHSEKNDTVLPLVNPGENYNILAMLDGNLDLEQSDEQVLVALPLDKINSSLVLMIASTNPIRNQYDIVWTAPLSTRTLTGITLHSDDLTGNGRSDIIITGFATPSSMREYLKDNTIEAFGLWDCGLQGAMGAYLAYWLALGNTFSVGDSIDIPGIGSVKVESNDIQGYKNAPKDTGIVLLPERVVFTTANVDDYNF